jgi:3'(2'), 5'-bisphosphate nucleotidase
VVTPRTDPLPPITAALLDALTDVVARAAAAILEVPRGQLDTTMKADNSPVTAADMAADAVIAEGMARLLPHLPVISEERCGPMPATASKTFALIDPLDGTKEFIAGRGEYTVNLAIIRDGRPVAGLVAAPAGGALYRGAAGLGAQKFALSGAEVRSGAAIEIRTRPAPPDHLTAVVSRSHLDAATIEYLSHYPVARQIAIGSSLKLCRLAEGLADLYPRLSPQSEWDLAAGHAVLAAAGGLVTTPDGRPLLYGAHPALQVPGFIAWGDPALASRIRSSPS